MLIQTKSDGEVEISEKQKIFFPNGIIGFESYKNYALLDSKSPPFYWLQSLDDVNIAFVILSPFLVVENYSLDISPSSYESIEFDGDVNSDRLLIFTIVTIVDDESGVITVNLQAPVIINKENKYAIQSIQNNPKWEIRHVISKKKS